jgi:[ribosomal protein S5]-alanine N-acetyltransferase
MVTTQRLTIRPFAVGDAADLHAYLSDPEVYRFEPGEPVTLAQASELARERAAGTDFWAIELNGTGEVIGHLYFARTEPAEWRTWELGYIVSPAHQRQGYGSEAATALLREGFEAWPIHRVVAHCNPDNPASWKLLERVGFRREALLRKNVFFRRGRDGAEAWTDTYVYAMLEEEADRRLPSAGARGDGSRPGGDPRP